MPRNPICPALVSGSSPSERPTPHDVTDLEIIAAVLRGDVRAERELYDAHVDRVYRLAWRMAGDETLARDFARDFTQDTFIRAFERLRDFREDSSLGLAAIVDADDRSAAGVEPELPRVTRRDRVARPAPRLVRFGATDHDGR